MKTKTPLDYEVESSTFKRRLESCRFFSVWVTGFLVGIVLLLSAMLYFCNTAHAGGFVEVGTAEYKTPPNTLWWQDVDGYAINKDMTDRYFRLGHEFPINRNFGYRLSAFSLGKYSLWAEVNTDEKCVIREGKASAKANCGPSEAVETHGSIRGFGLTLVARSSGAFRVFGEAGYTYNRQTFRLYQCSLCFDVKNTYNETISGGGRMLNVGIEYQNFTASIFFYSTNIGNWVGATTTGGPYPTGTGDVRGLSIGYRF